MFLLPNTSTELYDKWEDGLGVPLAAPLLPLLWNGSADRCGAIRDRSSSRHDRGPGPQAPIDEIRASARSEQRTTARGERKERTPETDDDDAVSVDGVIRVRRAG